MPADRRWSDADRELVARTLFADGTSPQRWAEHVVRNPVTAKFMRRKADAVLDALTAAGWRRTVPLPEWPEVEAEGRRQAAADILSEVDGLRGYAVDYVAGMRRAATIARGDVDA